MGPSWTLKEILSLISTPRSSKTCLSHTMGTNCSPLDNALVFRMLFSHRCLPALVGEELIMLNRGMKLPMFVSGKNAVTNSVTVVPSRKMSSVCLK